MKICFFKVCSSNKSCFSDMENTYKELLVPNIAGKWFENIEKTMDYPGIVDNIIGMNQFRSN